MESSRLPRFNRALTVAPMQLTERDREVIWLVHRHRFLRSSHICSLIPGSPQQMLRRLQLLYHHGYLERPRCQLDYYHQGGSREIVYGLGDKGASFLKQEPGSASRKTLWPRRNHPVGRVLLEHTLLVSEVMVAIERACREKGIRLLTERELAPANHTNGGHQRFRWKVKVNGKNLGVVPDRVFALETTSGAGEVNRAFFFLEADRGTMPVKRSHLSQTSFYRKLLEYETTWSQSIHQTRFGFNRFRVLTVTTNTKRVKHLIEACGKLERGRGLFLFTDIESVHSKPDFFSLAWQTAQPGITAQLLD